MPAYIDSSSPVPVYNNTTLQENIFFRNHKFFFQQRNYFKLLCTNHLSFITCNGPQRQKKDKNFQVFKLQQDQLLIELKEILRNTFNSELKQEQLKIEREKLTFKKL